MAGKIIDFKTAAISAATTTGYVTIASTTGWYKNAICWISNTGQTTRRCIITEVASATQLGVLFRDTDSGTAPAYGRSNISAYNGGTIVQEDGQLIYNPNDLPLS
jgi:hypothetical protein